MGQYDYLLEAVNPTLTVAKMKMAISKSNMTKEDIDKWINKLENALIDDKALMAKNAIIWDSDEYRVTTASINCISALAAFLPVIGLAGSIAGAISASLGLGKAVTPPIIKKQVKNTEEVIRYLKKQRKTLEESAMYENDDCTTLYEINRILEAQEIINKNTESVNIEIIDESLKLNIAKIKMGIKKSHMKRADIDKWINKLEKSVAYDRAMISLSKGKFFDKVSNISVISISTIGILTGLVASLPIISIATPTGAIIAGSDKGKEITRKINIKTAQSFLNSTQEIIDYLKEERKTLTESTELTPSELLKKWNY